MAEPSTSPSCTVDLRGERVVVEKPPPASGGRPPPDAYIHCALNLFFDSTSKTAFFKLRIPVVPEENAFVYLHIPPENVSALVQDRSNDSNPTLARLCGSSARGTAGLQLSLREPALLIGPPEWPAPADKASEDVLANIQTLAAQTTLAIHVPHGAMSAFQLKSLCNATFGAAGVTTSPSHASYGRLYGGRGGKVIQGIWPTKRDDTESTADLLPSYDEVAGPSRSPPALEPGCPAPKKRRLESSSPDVEAAANVALVERSEHFRDQMRAFVRDAMREDMAQQREELRGVVISELEKLETRIMSSVAEQIDRLRDDLIERIDEATAQAVSRDDLEDIVDDRAAGMKIEVEDFVKDEMRGVEDKMLDHFENGTWYGSFRRPEET